MTDDSFKLFSCFEFQSSTPTILHDGDMCFFKFFLFFFNLHMTTALCGTITFQWKAVNCSDCLAALLLNNQSAELHIDADVIAIKGQNPSSTHLFSYIFLSSLQSPIVLLFLVLLLYSSLSYCHIQPLGCPSNSLMEKTCCQSHTGARELENDGRSHFWGHSALPELEVSSSPFTSSGCVI